MKNKGKREQYLGEMLISVIVGEVITMVIFSLVHQIFTSPGEVIAFWMGTHTTAVYAVWSVIVWIDEAKRGEGKKRKASGKILPFRRVA